MRLSTLVQAVLANSVRTPSAMLKATTSDELSPLALSADATSGVSSIDFRKLHIFLACVRDDVIDLRAHLRFQVLDVDDLYALYDRAGLSGRFLCLGLRGCSLCLHKSRRPEGDGCNNGGCRKEAHAFSFPVSKLRKTPIHEIWLASDFHVAIQ